MALTHAQRDAISYDNDILSRIRGALCVQGCGYLDNEKAAQSEKDWAANLFWAGKRLAQIAIDMGPQVAGMHEMSMDISDDDLQKIVSSICFNYR